MSRKQKQPHQRRLTVARASVDTALQAFERAAVSLEAAADEAAAVVIDVETEVYELTQTRDDAYRQKVSYAARAAKIREFLK